MNLRQIVDNITGLSNNSPKVQTNFKLNDQVVVKKLVGSARIGMKEVMVGTIAAFAESGKSAVVSIPRPGGKQLRCTVPVGQLSAVTEVFKRSRVQINPALRGSV
jgi:hypothetical protein